MDPEEAQCGRLETFKAGRASLPNVPDPLAGSPDLPLLEALHRIRAWEGELLPAAELRSSVPGFKAQKGIYKPAASPYALWIRETSDGPYADQSPKYFPDGSWSYEYSPEGRNGVTDLELPTNRGLLKCMVDRVPVGVFRQGADISGRSAYKVLGLAYVERLDHDRFVIRGEPIDVTTEPIRPQSIPPFAPFEPAGAVKASVVRTLRDRRFSSVVREVYRERCSLCDLGYRYRGRSLALEAAHVIPVESKGIVADVRNGILLCRNHHSLFDSYAWTMDEELRVVVTEDRDFRKSAEANHVLGWEGRRLLNLPESKDNFPAAEAIEWRLAAYAARE